MSWLGESDHDPDFKVSQSPLFSSLFSTVDWTVKGCNRHKS